MKYIVYILITEFKIQSSFFTQRDSRFERGFADESDVLCIIITTFIYTWS